MDNLENLTASDDGAVQPADYAPSAPCSQADIQPESILLEAAAAEAFVAASAPSPAGAPAPTAPKNVQKHLFRIENGAFIMSPTLAIIMACVMVFSLFSGVISFCALVFKSPEAAKVYKNAINAIVEVRGYTVTGEQRSYASGFFINSDGYVVTSYHVVTNNFALSVRLFNGSEYDVVAVVGTDASADLAILKVDIKGCPYLKLASGLPHVGERVYAIGSPNSYPRSMSEGIISSLREITPGKAPTIQHTASISGGSSGCPILDKNGNVLGVQSSYDPAGASLFFASSALTIDIIDQSAPQGIIEFAIHSAADITHNLIYSVINGEAHIIGFFYGEYSSFIKIPAEINGYPVVAFEPDPSYMPSMPNVAHITFSEGIRSIGTNALTNMGSLRSIYIPNSLVNAQISSFNNGGLKKVFLETQNTGFVIENETLYSAQKTVLFKNLATEFSGGQFVVPSGVEYISPAAFFGKAGLTKVVIPDTVLALGLATESDSSFSGAFEECYNLVEVQFGQNSDLRLIGDRCFRSTAIDGFIVPASVSVLGNHAFSSMSRLKNIWFLGAKLPELNYLSLQKPQNYNIIISEAAEGDVVGEWQNYDVIIDVGGESGGGSQGGGA